MEIIKKILDLPVIVQGALGSLLFWLCFEVAKRSVGHATKFIAKHNSNWKEESLSIQVAHLALGMPTQENAAISISFLVAINRAIIGLIYVCFGLICGVTSLEPIAMIAYGFAVVFFFRAYKAVEIDFRLSLSLDERIKRVADLESQLKKLRESRSKRA